MHLALTLNPFDDSDLLYAQQLGVNWIVGDLPDWDYETLASAGNRVAKSGLYLRALSCLPNKLLAEAILDQSARDRALDQVCQIITDAGKLGIPCLGYTWPVTQPATLVETSAGRGEALSGIYPLYDSLKSGRIDRREEMWATLSHFLDRVMPVAEAAHVQLAYRTDISLASQPADMRILDSVAELDRLFQVAGSLYHGLDLDHGFLTQVLLNQTDMKVDEVIGHLGMHRRIFSVRMRNLRRTTNGAQEFFFDEDKVEILKALQGYQNSGFEGPLCPIPSPGMTDDTEWRHKGYAFSIGYLRGLLQVLG